MGDIDLAPDLDPVGKAGAGQPAGNVGQGQQIGGDVLPHPAVAPGRAAHEHPVLVEQAGGQAVDLRLGGEGDRSFVQPQEPADPADEVLHVRRLEGVVEAEHRHPVLHRRKALRRGRTHPVGRGIRADQRREPRLDRRIAPLQGVIVGVGDGGGVLTIIARVMGRDLGGQPRQFLGGLGLAQGRDGGQYHGAIILRSGCGPRPGPRR